MTQQEFTERTGILPADGELGYINDLYLNTSMEKDEFCADFKKYGESKIIRDLHARLVNYQLESKKICSGIEDIPKQPRMGQYIV